MVSRCTSRWLVAGLVVVFVSPLAGQPGPKVIPLPAPADDSLPAEARLRIGSQRFRDAGYIGAARIAPDGKTIAMVSQGQMIRILEIATGKEVKRFQLQEPPRNNQINYTDDGKQIVIVGYNGVHFWDVEKGTRTKHIQFNRNPNMPVYNTSLALSGDSKLLAQGSQDRGDGVGNATVMNIDENKEVTKVNPVQNSTVHPALSKDGKLLVTWGQYYNRQGGAIKEDENPNRMVQIWDVATGKEKHKLMTDAYQIQTVRFSPDGKKLATAGNGVVQLWDLDKGKLERRFPCRSGQGSAIAFSPDGKTLAAAGRDSTVQLWEVATGKRLGMCEGPLVAQTSLQYRPDGQLLAWGVQRVALHIWEVPSGKRLTPEGGHQAAISGLCFEPDGKSLVSASNDGRVLRWDPSTGKEQEPLHIKVSNDENRSNYGFKRAMVYGGQAAFSPNGKYIVGGSDYGPASAVYEFPSGSEVFSLVAPGGNVDRNGPVIFSPDSSKVTILSRNGNRQNQAITVWELETGLPLPQLKGQQGELHAGGFSTDGKLLATASMNNTPQGQQLSEIHVWEVETGKDLRTIHQPNYCMAVLFLDHRRFLASSAGTGWKLYDGPSGKEIGAYEGNMTQITSTPVRSPDGRLVAVGLAMPGTYYPDGRLVQKPPRIVVWETASGMIRHEFEGHLGNVSALAFAPDGSTLVSGALDTTILFWDLRGKAGKEPPLKPDDLQAIWKTLDERNAQAAEKALRRLSARPGEAIGFFRDHLKPVEGVGVDAAAIAKLIGELDAGRFIVRENASKQLEKIGQPALQALRAALKGNASEELRERIEKLMARLDRPDDGEQWLRPLRGVEALERMATPEARDLLAKLAKGADAPPTRAAAEALARLGK